MTAENYLSQALVLDFAIRSAMAQAEKLHEDAILLRKYSKTTLPNSRITKNQMQNTIKKITAKEHEINNLINEYMDRKEEICTVLANLHNPIQRAIMEQHYLCGKKWEQVAEENFLSERQVFRYRNAALKELEENYYDIVK